MATAFEGSKPAHSGDSLGSTDLQHFINLRALKLLNDYCHRTRPVNSSQYSQTVAPTGENLPIPPNSHIPAAQAGFDIMHTLCRRLDEYIRYSDVAAKNVEMLLEAERICVLLNGLRVTFCKSGKDRTGMAVTLEQARILGERFSCGNTHARLQRDANIMREYGCRVLVAEKNIGRKVYSINSLQTQFIPQLYRPPVNVQESLIKGGDLS